MVINPDDIRIELDIENRVLPRSLIRNQIEQQGFCLLRSPCIDEEELIRIANSLGRIQGHERSKPNGIVDVTSDPNIYSQNENRTFQGLGNQVFEPHTDGAFLNALYRDGKMIMRHISPPAMLILQCVTQELIGGNSLLIDGKCVYNSIKDKSPEMLEILFESIFHFVRNGSELFPIDSPIFKHMSNGNICVRFRTEYIISALCNRNRSYVENCIERMFEDFLMSPDCSRSILLSPGDMLIIDNFRMLHGRAPFSIVDGHHRHLRRLWITDEEHLQRLNGDNTMSLSIDESRLAEFDARVHPFDHPVVKAYGIASDSSSVRDFITPKLGIKP